MPNYVECPFCERIFEDRYTTDDGRRSSPPRASIREPANDRLSHHIEQDHHKVRVRKGSNYKWVDAREIQQRLEESDKLLVKGRK